MSKDQTLSGGYRNEALRDARDVPSDRPHSADNRESPSAATAEDAYGRNEMSKAWARESYRADYRRAGTGRRNEFGSKRVDGRETKREPE